MSATKQVFAETFTLLGLRHDRLEQSPHDVTPTHVANRFEIPGLGPVRHDCYSRGSSLFSRFYHIESGAFAWYRVTEAAPSSPEKASLENSNSDSGQTLGRKTP